MIDYFYLIKKGKRKVKWNRRLRVGRVVLSAGVLLGLIGMDEGIFKREQRGVVVGARFEGYLNQDDILDHVEVLDSVNGIGRFCFGTEEGDYDCGIVNVGEYVRRDSRVFVKTESGRKYVVRKSKFPEEAREWLESVDR